MDKEQCDVGRAAEAATTKVMLRRSQQRMAFEQAGTQLSIQEWKQASRQVFEQAKKQVDKQIRMEASKWLKDKSKMA